MKYREGKREQIDFFKTDVKPIAEITRYGAKHFKLWMISEARVNESSTKDAIVLSEITERYRVDESNMHTTFERIVTRAGLEP